MTNGQAFLNEAEDLLKGAENDMRWRTAVSRAYLAVYHHVTSHEACGGVLTTVEEKIRHARIADHYTPGRQNLLIKQLVQSGDRNLILIASRMHELQTRQARADYVIGDRMNQQTATLAVMTAQSIFTDLPA